MLELNVLALMVSSQAALPGMRKRGGGDIINISSTAGRIANPAGAGYSASKFGVVAFSEALRREVQKDKIRVCVIEPGLVATELRDHIPDPTTKKTIDCMGGVGAAVTAGRHCECGGLRCVAAAACQRQ